MADGSDRVRQRAERWARDVWCEAIGTSSLPSRVRLVAFALATFMNPDGLANPALQTLADRAGIGRSTAGRAIARLIAEGWLSRVGGGGGRHRTTTYRVETVPPGSDGFSESPVEKPSQNAPKPSQNGAETVPPGSDTNRRTEEQSAPASDPLRGSPAPWVELGLSWVEYSKLERRTEP